MKTILSNLTQLKGVHSVFIYDDSKTLYSTFNSQQNDAITKVGKTIEQFFSALRAIDQSHDEIYFSLPNHFLVAYLVNKKMIVGLLTDKKINFPLIHMGIKTAERKLVLKESSQLIHSVVDIKPPTIEKKIPTSSIDSYKNKLSDLLINFLGPAAPIVIDDSINKWKNKYPQTPDNIPQLIELINKELDNKTEKDDFKKLALKSLASYQ